MNNNINIPDLPDGTDRKWTDLDELIVAIFEHPDAPYWMKDALWEAINDHSYIDSFDPAFVRVMLFFCSFDDKKGRKRK